MTSQVPDPPLGRPDRAAPVQTTHAIVHRGLRLPAFLRAEISMSQLGAAVAATTVVVGGLGAGARVSHGGGNSSPKATHPVLVEHPGCDEQPPEASPPDGNVRVAVPPTALVHVDAGGGVIGAVTNTGCAPRPTDDIYVVAPTGDARPAPPGLADRPWHGDFRTRGALVSQIVAS